VETGNISEAGCRVLSSSGETMKPSHLGPLESLMSLSPGNKNMNQFLVVWFNWTTEPDTVSETSCLRNQDDG
jgi:hypothetical protein